MASPATEGPVDVNHGKAHQIATTRAATALGIMSNLAVELRVAQRTYEAFYPSRDRSNRWLGGAPSGRASKGDGASERQDNNAREADDAGSQLQPPFDHGASAVNCDYTR